MYNLENWTFFYTTDDDGIWITNGEVDIWLGFDATIQDAIDSVEAL